MKHAVIKRPVIISMIQDYADPKEIIEIGQIHRNKRIEALIMVRALNDNVIKENYGLYRKFYFAKYNSNGKRLILVPKTGEKLMDNDPQYVNRINELDPEV